MQAYWHEDESMVTSHPAHEFMYEYGCFVAFWSNFELQMEVAIFELSGRPAKDVCKEINPMTAGGKRKILQGLLLRNDKRDLLDALDAVFNVADRNSWLHGHILNPNGDFSLLRRLRIERNGNDLVVKNSDISFETSPFTAFYEAFGDFALQFGLTKGRCNNYIRQLMES